MAVKTEDTEVESLVQKVTSEGDTSMDVTNTKPEHVKSASVTEGKVGERAVKSEPEGKTQHQRGFKDGELSDKPCKITQHDNLSVSEPSVSVPETEGVTSAGAVTEQRKDCTCVRGGDKLFCDTSVSKDICWDEAHSCVMHSSLSDTRSEGRICALPYSPASAVKSEDRDLRRIENSRPSEGSDAASQEQSSHEDAAKDSTPRGPCDEAARTIPTTSPGNSVQCDTRVQTLKNTEEDFKREESSSPDVCANQSSNKLPSQQKAETACSKTGVESPLKRCFTETENCKSEEPCKKPRLENT